MLTNGNCGISEAQVIGQHFLDDKDILAYLDSLQDLNAFNGVIVLELRHYNMTQIAWIRDAQYFTGVHLGHQPTELEVCEELMRNRTPQRFKAFYSLKYPDKVVME